MTKYTTIEIDRDAADLLKLDAFINKRRQRDNASELITKILSEKLKGVDIADLMREQNDSSN